MAAERNENFQKRLQRLREQRGVSRVALSELCGLSRNTIERYEKGQRKPTAEALCALAEYFGVTTDYLLCRKDEREY